MSKETKGVKQEKLDKIYVTRKEASELLSVSIRTIQRLAKRGQLTEYKLGGVRMVRYLVDDLYKVMEKKSNQTTKYN